jgi:hypothetical protein
MPRSPSGERLRQAPEAHKQAGRPLEPLPCQIVLSDELDGIKVRISDESRDMQLR